MQQVLACKNMQHFLQTILLATLQVDMPVKMDGCLEKKKTASSQMTPFKNRVRLSSELKSMTYQYFANVLM